MGETERPGGPTPESHQDARTVCGEPPAGHRPDPLSLRSTRRKSVTGVWAWTGLNRTTSNVRTCSFRFSDFMENSQLSGGKTSRTRVPSHHPWCHTRGWGQRTSPPGADRGLTGRPARVPRLLPNRGVPFISLLQRALAGSHTQVLRFSSECPSRSRGEPGGPASGPQCPGNWTPPARVVNKRVWGPWAPGQWPTGSPSTSSGPALQHHRPGTHHGSVGHCQPHQ